MMGFSKTMRKPMMAGIAVSLAFCLILAWFFNAKLLTHYYVYQLQHADKAEFDYWSERLFAQDTSGTAALIETLGSDDAFLGTSALKALKKWLAARKIDEENLTKLAELLAVQLPNLNTVGRYRGLDLACALAAALNKDGPGFGDCRKALSSVLLSSSMAKNNGATSKSLLLVELMLLKSPNIETIKACSGVVQNGLKDSLPQNRINALRLAPHPSINLLQQAALLLRDKIPEVRASAMVAVGRASDVMSTDDLIHWLHDPNPDVRRLCEIALRGRGLPDDHVHLARFLSDGNPRTRLKVLELVRNNQSLDAGVWIRKLTYDTSPAVRAAAVRASVNPLMPNLTKRLQEIAREDPDPTVRQLATYYLRNQSNACRMMDAN